jgi:hypothetical protein
MGRCVRLMLIGYNDANMTHLVSAPYSYSCKATPKDAEDQLEAAMGAANALRTVHGTPFVVSLLTNHGNSLLTTHYRPEHSARIYIGKLTSILSEAIY